jgi:ADP-heptose:LPS heptosyltransferase
MDRKIAAQIAETITNEQILDMFNRAKSEIEDWMKRSKVNKGMTKGAAWNILAADFKVHHKYNVLAITNMIQEFGDYLPKELIPKKKYVRYPKPFHQEPKL